MNTRNDVFPDIGWEEAAVLSHACIEMNTCNAECMGHDRCGEAAASALSRTFIELKSCNAALLDEMTNLDKRSMLRVDGTGLLSYADHFNKRFFHSLLKGKNANSSIKGILINGIWEDTPDVIKNAAIEHFSSRFKESGLIRPSFSNIIFRKLFEVDAMFLEYGFYLEEVKEPVFDAMFLEYGFYLEEVKEPVHLKSSRAQKEQRSSVYSY
nr:hypothetical protein [Tanacetum cinerariifolium]